MYICFWGVDIDSEIDFWRSASENRFYIFYSEYFLNRYIRTTYIGYIEFPVGLGL